MVVVTYSYDAWGNLLDIWDVSGYNVGALNPIRYRGYYFDVESGYYYCQSRYYNPQWCRWISADVYLDTGDGVLGTNMYCYCGNDAVNMADPTGTKAKYNPGALVIDTNKYKKFFSFISYGALSINGSSLVSLAANEGVVHYFKSLYSTPRYGIMGA